VGGDGTIPWVLKLALDAKIDFEKVAIGIVPIGTGNDFSRSVGWGYNTVKFDAEDFGSLNKLVKKWNNA
jgi:diacylglycerol kinase family enzyme